MIISTNATAPTKVKRRDEIDRQTDRQTDRQREKKGQKVSKGEGYESVHRKKQKSSNV